jgi:hypothetical protein
MMALMAINMKDDVTLVASYHPADDCQRAVCRAIVNNDTFQLHISILLSNNRLKTLLHRRLMVVG